MSHEPHHVHGYWRRHAAALFRWLHIYLSMVSFAILFFFAITGITLNHAGWFGKDAARTRTQKGTVQLSWVKTTEAAAVDKLRIVEQLRAVRAETQHLIEIEGCELSRQGLLERWALARVEDRVVDEVRWRVRLIGSHEVDEGALAHRPERVVRAALLAERG